MKPLQPIPKPPDKRTTLILPKEQVMNMSELSTGTLLLIAENEMANSNTDIVCECLAEAASRILKERSKPGANRNELLFVESVLYHESGDYQKTYNLLGELSRILSDFRNHAASQWHASAMGHLQQGERSAIAAKIKKTITTNSDIALTSLNDNPFCTDRKHLAELRSKISRHMGDENLANLFDKDAERLSKTC